MLARVVSKKSILAESNGVSGSVKKGRSLVVDAQETVTKRTCCSTA
ncbi:unnamed protein product [Cuscuta europaea]|uniref:Uncharacterized protein n=1 Tax=Cuscuta europaea TaxID=41803 RepID=A0A9P0Z0H0_CUSEU|nr:unnamed protein product [Cuscuta europaea]